MTSVSEHDYQSARYLYLPVKIIHYLQRVLLYSKHYLVNKQLLKSKLQSGSLTLRCAKTTFISEGRTEALYNKV